jgi:MscS family membrane protein
MDWIPEPLRAIGPVGVAWWQWIALAAALIGARVIGGLVTRVVLWIARRLTGKTATTLDDVLLAKLAGPFRLLGWVAILRVTVPVIELPHNASEVAVDAMLAAFAIALVWGALRAIDVVAQRVSTASWAAQRPASRALLSLISRAAKVVVMVIAGIGFLGGIGLPVSSLLAGLGIGGIAVAFGAQKTVENLFGAFAIGVDQPLREGDYVRIEKDVEGTVETVGLRSTRIRTADRTLVTLPNGRLADMRIETFAARDRCRFAITLGLVYATSAAQMRKVLDGVDRLLRDHPKVWPSDIVVRFLAIGTSSLDIEIGAWFDTTDYNVFRDCRQATLLGIMDIVEKSGTSLAFPTRTVHVVGPARDPRSS